MNVRQSKWKWPKWRFTVVWAIGILFFLTSYSSSFANIIFLATLLQITTCGRHVTPAGHHYHHDRTGMDHMMTLAPTRDLFSKLVITFVWHLHEHAFLFNLIFFFLFSVFYFLLRLSLWHDTFSFFFTFSFAFSNLLSLAHTFYYFKKVSYENRSVLK